MKKLIALLLALTMLMALCSCKKKNKIDDDTNDLLSGESTVEIDKDGEGMKADLNGDGIDEIIKTETMTDDLGYESGWRLVVKDSGDGSTRNSENEGILSGANIIDLNYSDNLKEIAVTYDYASDDYATTIYRYVDGALIHTPEIRGKYTAVNNGIVTVYYNVDVLGSNWPAYTTYALSDKGGFELVRNDRLWYIEYSEDDYLTTNQALAIRNEDGIIETLPEGTRIVPISSDLDTIINIKTEDGRIGTITVDKDSNGNAVVDADDVENIADGIQYAG